MAKNEKIKEAVDELTGMSKDEELRILAELRVKGRRDEYARRQYAIKEGITQDKREIAKKMIKKEMKIEDICEITGLAVEEVEELK